MMMMMTMMMTMMAMMAMMVAAGFTNTMHASVPFHSHVARPSTAEAQVAALVATGSITPANMWVTCGAQAFNSDVVFQAQAGIKAKADIEAAAKEADAEHELAECKAAGSAALKTLGLRPISSLVLPNLKAIVKFVYLKRKDRGYSKHVTKAACCAFLCSCMSEWQCLLSVDAPVPPSASPHATATTPAPFVQSTPAPTTAVIDLTTLTKAQRRELLAQVTAAVHADGDSD